LLSYTVKLSYLEFNFGKVYECLKELGIEKGLISIEIYLNEKVTFRQTDKAFDVPADQLKAYEIEELILYTRRQNAN